MSRRSGVLRPLPMLWVLAAGILGSSVSPTASAACKRDEPGYVWNYDGDIGGKYRARMSLVFRGRALEGVYFYANQLRDIRLRGRIDEDGQRVLLEELNPDGSVNARFEGEFPLRWPARYGESELQCDVIAGRWTRAGAAESQPFFFASESATSPLRARPQAASRIAMARSAFATTKWCIAARRVSGVPSRRVTAPASQPRCATPSPSRSVASRCG